MHTNHKAKSEGQEIIKFETIFCHYSKCLVHRCLIDSFQSTREKSKLRTSFNLLCVGHMMGKRYFKGQWDEKSMCTCTISIDFYPVMFNPRVSHTNFHHLRPLIGCSRHFFSFFNAIGRSAKKYGQVGCP